MTDSGSETRPRCLGLGKSLKRFESASLAACSAGITRRSVNTLRCGCTTLLLLSLPVLPVRAAPAPAPPAQVQPPFLTSIFPGGGQRGKTVTLTVYGRDLQHITSASVTGRGVTAKVIGTNKADRAQVEITLAPDAEVHEQDIRVLNAAGPSNRWRFLVGDIPETNETEPNDTLDQTQKLASLPIVINGQTFAGDRDYYRFEATAGQTIVLSVQARSLLPYIGDAVPGWCDAVLTLYDNLGKVIESVDDFRSNPDPLILFKVPKDGIYSVCINDILFRGRTDFMYRLTIGAVPCITHIFPLGGQRGTTAKVQLSGANLPATNLNVAIPADSLPTREVGLTGVSPRSNLLPFAADDAKEAFESEPNDAPGQTNRVEVPVNINGRIQRPGDVDYFVFKARANERLVMEVTARRLDSPLDSMITLFNAAGAELLENDDNDDPTQALLRHHADSRMTYTFPQAGDYLLRIRDTQGMGGDEYSYRLWIGPERPDYLLRITPDNPRIGKGETILLTVDSLRKDGFNGEIAVSVKDLPKGFTTSDAVLAPGQDTVPLTITAPSEAQLGVITPSIVGTAIIASNKVVRPGFAAEEVMQSFFFKYLVPTHDLLLAVLEAPPFSIIPQAPSQPELELKQGGELTIPVKAVRRDKVAQEASLSLQLVRPPAGVTAQPEVIPKEKNEGNLVIKATPQAPVGRYNVIISGTVRTGGQQDLVRIAPAIPIKIVAAKK